MEEGWNAQQLLHSCDATVQRQEVQRSSEEVKHSWRSRLQKEEEHGRSRS